MSQPPSRSPVTVELLGGSEVRGHFVSYHPASLEIETPAGRLFIPFNLIPEDLQRVFPNDCMTEIHRGLAAAREGAAKVALVAAEAVKLATANQFALDQLQAELPDLRARNEALKRQLAEAETENAELRARLGGDR